MSDYEQEPQPQSHDDLIRENERLRLQYEETQSESAPIPPKRSKGKLAALTTVAVLATGYVTGQVMNTPWSNLGSSSNEYTPEPDPPFLRAPSQTPAAIKKATPSPSPTASTTPSKEPSPSASASQTPTTLTSPSPSITEIPSPSASPTPQVELIAGQSGYFSALRPEAIARMEQCGNTSNRVLLSFEDGGSTKHINQIARVLERNNVGALFFPATAEVAAGVPDKLRSDGFWVGNHTYDNAALDEMDATSDIVADIRGGTPSNLLRPPGGAMHSEDGKAVFDTRIRTIADSIGLRTCLWTVDANDSRGRSTDQIEQTVVSQAGPGSVIRMNMANKYNTLRALQPMIDAVRAKGLEFCTLPQHPTTEKIPAALPCDD